VYPLATSLAFNRYKRFQLSSVLCFTRYSLPSFWQVDKRPRSIFYRRIVFVSRIACSHWWVIGMIDCFSKWFRFVTFPILAPTSSFFPCLFLIFPFYYFELNFIPQVGSELQVGLAAVSAISAVLAVVSLLDGDGDCRSKLNGSVPHYGNRKPSCRLEPFVFWYMNVCLFQGFWNALSRVLGIINNSNITDAQRLQLSQHSLLLLNSTSTDCIFGIHFLPDTTPTVFPP